MGIIISTDFLTSNCPERCEHIFFLPFCTAQRVTSYNVIRFIFFSTKVPMYHVYKLKIRAFNFCFVFFSSLRNPLLSKCPSGYLATVKGNY